MPKKPVKKMKTVQIPDNIFAMLNIIAEIKNVSINELAADFSKNYVDENMHLIIDEFEKLKKEKTNGIKN